MNSADPIILLDFTETMEFDTLSESLLRQSKVFGFKLDFERITREKCNHLALAAKSECADKSPVGAHTASSYHTAIRMIASMRE